MRGAPGDDDRRSGVRLRELSRHRRAILRAMFLSAVAAGLLAIVALIALESADRETLRRQTQKQWDTYNGLAKFHYGDIDELTTTRYRNMMHVVILCASEALVLLAATLLFGNDQFGMDRRTTYAASAPPVFLHHDRHRSPLGWGSVKRRELHRERPRGAALALRSSGYGTCLGPSEGAMKKLD